MNTLQMIAILATLLLVVGGLHWGLVAVANVVLAAALIGAREIGARNVLAAVACRPVGRPPGYQALARNRSRRGVA